MDLMNQAQLTQVYLDKSGKGSTLLYFKEIAMTEQSSIFFKYPLDQMVN